MIGISVTNESTVISDSDVQALLPAFVTQWNEHLLPAWALDTVDMTFLPAGATPPPTSWWLVFLDDTDQAGALAYHDLTDQGLPIAKVFVKTIQADGSSVSVGATHEICEMAVDPSINRTAQDAQGTTWACEICDPVQSDQYAYEINGVMVTDFVVPAWFSPAEAPGPFDYRNQVPAAFQVLPAGYAQWLGAAGWNQVNGKTVTSQRALQVATGSRRERRPRKGTELSASADKRKLLRERYARAHAGRTPG